MGKIKSHQDVQNAYDAKQDKAIKLMGKGKEKKAEKIMDRAQKKYEKRNLAFPLAESNHGKAFSIPKTISEKKGL